MSKPPEKSRMSISANLQPVVTNFSLKDHIYGVL
ncbi:MAG: hypothetical protein ACI9UN_005340, partial [Granulosicoccus sp.]